MWKTQIVKDFRLLQIEMGCAAVQFRLKRQNGMNDWRNDKKSRGCLIFDHKTASYVNRSGLEIKTDKFLRL
jgi:hypothetical protein